MRKLDDLDLKIIEILQKDCRVSLVSIARQLGKSVSAISYRLNRLMRMGIIKRCVAIVDAEALGLTYDVIIMMRVVPGKLADLTKFLKERDEVQLAFTITGAYDLCIYALFRNEDEYFEFIEQLHSTNYVLETTTFTIVKKIKDNLKYL